MTTIADLQANLEDFSVQGDTSQRLYAFIGVNEDTTAHIMTEEEVMEHATEMQLDPDAEPFTDIDEALEYIQEMCEDKIYELSWV